MRNALGSPCLNLYITIHSHSSDMPVECMLYMQSTLGRVGQPALALYSLYVYFGPFLLDLTIIDPVQRP